MNVLVLASSAQRADKAPPDSAVQLTRALSELGHSCELLCCMGWAELSARAAMICLRRKPDAIHAFGGTVVVASALQVLFGIPYLYGMDFVPEEGFVARRIRSAGSQALAVTTPCPALTNFARRDAVFRRVIELPGISQIEGAPVGDSVRIRERFAGTGLVFMYLGGLEPHEGVGLLLEAFSLHLKKHAADVLVVAGGSAQDAQWFEQRAAQLGCARAAHLLPAQPLNLWPAFFAEADVLVSPRIKRQEVPGNLYAYLDSGRAVLATRLTAHTQVVSDAECVLADATPEQMAEGMRKLAASEELRTRVASAAKQLVATKHCRAAHRAAVESIYQLVAGAKAGSFQ